MKRRMTEWMNDWQIRLDWVGLDWMGLGSFNKSWNECKKEGMKEHAQVKTDTCTLYKAKI